MADQADKKHQKVFVPSQAKADQINEQVDEQDKQKEKQPA